MIISLYSPTQQSGKSTVAQYLNKHYGFSLIKFADPLYRMVFSIASYVCCNEQEAYRRVYDAKEEIWPEIGVSTRTLLRTLGTEWGRNTISESIWVDIVRARLNFVRQYDFDIVLDDNRFKNETLMLREFDTIFVRIVRPDAYVDRSHQSEGLLDDFDFDYTIVNDGSIGDLYRKVDDMMETIRSG